MKREFLQNLKVGDQPLSKEVIDQIMAENGRDIEAAKKPFEDYGTIKTQLEEAQRTIKGFEEQDIEGVRRSAKEWQEKYDAAVEAHKQELADRDFQQALDGAIGKAKGKNAKAIKALLDLEALKGSKNQEADIKAALEGLQKESGYLFDDGEVPPGYAGGGGAAPKGGQTLAGALRERYGK